MYKTIGLSQFCGEFHDMGRGEQFSCEALEIIYDYLEEVDPDGELDVIEVCCEYSEETWQEVVEHYEIEDMEDTDNTEEFKEKVRDYLEEHTTVLGETDDTIIYIQF